MAGRKLKKGPRQRSFFLCIENPPYIIFAVRNRRLATGKTGACLREKLPPNGSDEGALQNVSAAGRIVNAHHAADPRIRRLSARKGTERLPVSGLRASDAPPVRPFRMRVAHAGSHGLSPKAHRPSRRIFSGSRREAVQFLRPRMRPEKKVTHQLSWWVFIILRLRLVPPKAGRAQPLTTSSCATRT